MKKAWFGGATVLFLVLSGAAQPSLAMRITEVATAGASGSGSDYPPYIEVYAPSATAAFDLVIVGASPFRRQSPYLTLASITPRAGVDTYLIHEGDWPAPPAVGPLAGGDAAVSGPLYLSSSYYDVSRSLLLFDHATGFNFSTDREDLLGEGGLRDVVTYAFNDGLVSAFQEEPVVPLRGDANGLIRLRDETDYLDAFASGPVMTDDLGLRLGGGPRLSPGLTNTLEEPVETAAVPEPTSALLVLTLMASALLSRRLRAPHRRC